MLIGISRYRFTFSHLQLAMQRHRLGSEYGIPPESFAYTEVQRIGNSHTHFNSTTLFSVEARICPQPLGLYLRTQLWILFHTAQCKGSFRICDHISQYPFGQFLLPRLNHTRSQTNISTCLECNMDLQVKIEEVTNEGPAIVVTKWIDLGAGLCPMDPK